jgi:hypothetical protein
MRRVIEAHSPLTSLFFTNLLELPDAGINELLEDLKILQREKSNDSRTVFRLYERIETHRRNSAAKIMYVSRPYQRMLTDGRIEMRSNRSL